MDKTTLRVLSLIVVLATIVAFLLAASASISVSAYEGPKATASAARPSSTARGPSNTATPTPAAVDRSQPGSTDGLALMSFIIALIIIIPLLLQRALWGK